MKGQRPIVRNNICNGMKKLPYNNSLQLAQKQSNVIERKCCFEHRRRPSRIAAGSIKTCFAMLALVSVHSLYAVQSRLAVATLLTNGDLQISYTGFAAHPYALEWAGSLSPPATWTPMLTNTADSSGLVSFTDTRSGSHRFYRVHDVIPMPLVYAVENTGANCAAPPLPALGSLRLVQPLPDPFMWADWSGRSTDFLDWKCRRAEIEAQVEHYEIGPKPAVPAENVTAAYGGGILTVVVTRTNGRALTLTCQVTVPSGAGPFPAIIGMALAPGGGTGSLPSDIFSNCLQITYLHNQVTTYAAGQQISHTNDPYFLMYPEYAYAGQYSAWAWGVSRVIDGLYRVTNTLPIDLNHIAVTGCSYAGKMALFAGAMDERVALTLPQESGGGGATSWRYSHTEPAGSVESLENTDHSWFMQSMFQFGGENVYFLPEDHHELMAMCLPRALYVTANPDYTWLSNPSCYVASRACQQVYNTFGIGDRFGFSIVGGHSHCALPDSQRPEVQAFVDKFLFGKTNANTAITTHPDSYENSIDYAAWYQWWGTTNPVFPTLSSNSLTVTFEPECATVGTNWQSLSDTNASNGKFVTVTPGIQSLNSAPTNSAELIVIPFAVTNNGNYHLFARCNDPTADDDSFWVSMDDGPFTMLNGLVTSGWQWVSFATYSLTAGQHTLKIGYREDGAKLDKLSLSDYPFAPTGLGQSAGTLCP